jgi:hypothetical protein
MLIVFRGAPYVPTKSADVSSLFDVVKFKPGETLVDLGSGDGRLLKAAAERGISAVGYELNPFLVLVTWFRLRRHSRLAHVSMQDFWLSDLPNRTKVVFVFLGTPYMKKLDKYLTQQVARLGQDVRLVSYGVPVPGREPEQEDGALLVYLYKKA